VDFDKATISRKNTHQSPIAENPEIGFEYFTIEKDRSENVWS